MASIAAQVAALQTMTVDQLQARWKEVFGEETRQRHRQHLIKRLARQLQDDRPGLTPEEEAKVDRYRAMLRQMPESSWFPYARHNRQKRPEPSLRRRTLKPGTILTREWNGTEVAVTVREDGFAWKGGVYRSLSAVAKEVTGTTWNGWRFFGLTGGQ